MSLLVSMSWRLLLLPACGHAAAPDGGSGGSGGSSGGLACGDAGEALPWPALADGGLSPATFAPAFDAAWCSAMADCYPLADYLVAECAAALGSYGDFSFQECTVGLCGGRSAQPKLDVAASLRALDAGRLGFDPALARDCVAQRWPLACAAAGLVPIAPAACEAAFAGLVAPGGACWLDLECDAGGCLRDGGCPGRCGAAPPPGPGVAGDPCDASRPCAAGLSCALGWCWGGAALGSPCASEHDCAPGAYCSTVQGGTCRSQRGACASCDENLAAVQDAWSGQCAPGLFCRGLASLPDGGVAPGLCTAPVGEGAGCVVGITPAWTAGPVSGCLPGLDCMQGRCALPPQSGLCAQDDTPCYDGPSYCLDAVVRCEPTTAGACAESQCVPGMICLNGHCVSAAEAPTCPEP
ncbi:MAG: hypothetical protein ACYDCL_11015 [Myxococcales bacterium]